MFSRGDTGIRTGSPPHPVTASPCHPSEAREGHGRSLTQQYPPFLMYTAPSNIVNLLCPPLHTFPFFLPTICDTPVENFCAFPPFPAFSTKNLHRSLTTCGVFFLFFQEAVKTIPGILLIYASILSRYSRISIFSQPLTLYPHKLSTTVETVVDNFTELILFLPFCYLFR